MPRSTLFPYTTLFRSVTCQGKGCPARTSRRVAPPQRRRGRWTRFREFEGFLPAGAVVQVRVTKDGQIGAYTRFAVRNPSNSDRKSTRLNSSHVSISYAEIYTLSLHDALPICHLSGQGLSGPDVPPRRPAPAPEGTLDPLPGVRGIPAGGRRRPGPRHEGRSDRRLHPFRRQESLELRSEEHTSELQSRFDLVCRDLHSFPTRRSSDLSPVRARAVRPGRPAASPRPSAGGDAGPASGSSRDSCRRAPSSRSASRRTVRSAPTPVSPSGIPRTQIGRAHV